MEIKTVGVIGTGTMGGGIVELMLCQGMKVLWKSSSQSKASEKTQLIEKQLLRLSRKGKIEKEKVSTFLSNLVFCTEYSELSSSDLVIEAVIEDLSVKKSVLVELEKAVNKDCIIATNTSSLSISELCKSVSYPERFIGIHFFNPANIMKLVEVIAGKLTSDEIVKQICQLIENIDKTPVLVNEAPGFIVNRILIPMINEATSILSEGVASIKDIDTAMTLGANHPMGPLKLADFIGIDVVVAILDSMYEETGLVKYKPHYRLKNMVRCGHIGRKVKQGFYSY